MGYRAVRAGRQRLKTLIRQSPGCRKERQPGFLLPGKKLNRAGNWICLGIPLPAAPGLRGVAIVQNSAASSGDLPIELRSRRRRRASGT